jgi:ubiquitin C-terminal hydrolase
MIEKGETEVVKDIKNNYGIKAMINGGHNDFMQSVLQCLIGIESFNIGVINHAKSDNVYVAMLQRVLKGVFMISLDTLEEKDEVLDLEFIREEIPMWGNEN